MTNKPIALSLADVADLRAQIEDLAAAVLDATDRLSRRRLGRFEARRIALAARRKAVRILDAIERPETTRGGAP